LHDYHVYFLSWLRERGKTCQGFYGNVQLIEPIKHPLTKPRHTQTITQPSRCCRLLWNFYGKQHGESMLATD
jgi:hypothetical protein